MAARGARAAAETARYRLPGYWISFWLREINAMFGPVIGIIGALDHQDTLRGLALRREGMAMTQCRVGYSCRHGNPTMGAGGVHFAICGHPSRWREQQDLLHRLGRLRRRRGRGLCGADNGGVAFYMRSSATNCRKCMATGLGMRPTTGVS